MLYALLVLITMTQAGAPMVSTTITPQDNCAKLSEEAKKQQNAVVFCVPLEQLGRAVSDTK